MDRGEALCALLECKRVAIVGAPRTGKTVLADSVRVVGEGREILHTDDFSHLPWADVSGAVVARCAPLERFIVEGVQVARALRAGLVVDAVLYLDEPRAEQSKGQRAMGKAVATVFAEWRAEHLAVPVVSPDIHQ